MRPGAIEPGFQRREDRSSFVGDFTLRISSSGYHSYPLLYPLNKLVKVSVSPSSVSHSSKLIRPEEVTGPSDLELVGWSEAQLTAWGLPLASDMEGREQSCRIEPLTCGIECCLHIDSARIEF